MVSEKDVGLVVGGDKDLDLLVLKLDDAKVREDLRNLLAIESFLFEVF